MREFRTTPGYHPRCPRMTPCVVDPHRGWPSRWVDPDPLGKPAGAWRMPLYPQRGSQAANERAIIHPKQSEGLGYGLSVTGLGAGGYRSPRGP